MSSTSDRLGGLGVWVTRPEPQARDSSRAIQRCGGRPCCLPLVAIEPVEDEAAVLAIKRVILDLDQYDAALFISSNAARLGMQWIDSYWPQLPQDLSAFAIGPGTAEVLREFTWPVYLPESGVTSEDLLALPQLQQVEGWRLALFRGEGGREKLAASLRERGAEVDYVELYRRRNLEHDPAEVARMLETERIEVIVVTSAQILDGLVALSRYPEPGERLRKLPLIVPSARVGEQAREAAFEHVINAGGAGDETVIQCLEQLAGVPAGGRR